MYKRRENPYLIVGFGLAGACVARFLDKYNCNFEVIENGDSASRIASGLMVPISGKRFTLVKDYEKSYSEAVRFYNEINAESECNLFLSGNVRRDFVSCEDFDFWERRKKIGGLSIKDYIFSDDETSLFVKKSGLLDVREFLNFLRNEYLDRIKKADFDFDKLSLKEGRVFYKRKEYRKIIFCEGWRAVHNPFFRDNINFRLARGRNLLIRGDIDDNLLAFSRGKWMSRVLNNSELLRIGSTYEWSESENKLEELLKFSGNFEIVGEEFGIRPIIEKSIPFVGVHPANKSLSFFNGLGSKGVLNAPRFANLLVRNLLFGEEIPHISDIARFFSTDSIMI